MKTLQSLNRLIFYADTVIRTSQTLEFASRTFSKHTLTEDGPSIYMYKNMDVTIDSVTMQSVRSDYLCVRRTGAFSLRVSVRELLGDATNDGPDNELTTFYTKRRIRVKLTEGYGKMDCKVLKGSRGTRTFKTRTKRSKEIKSGYLYSITRNPAKKKKTKLPPIATRRLKRRLERGTTV